MENEPLMVDKVENEKEELPIWCEGCDQQGFIFVDDTQKPAFVVCSRCGFEASQVWCPKCEMGGDFVSDIEDRPIYWVCTSCMKRYSLPDNFYEEPVPLYIGEDRPKDVKIKAFPIQSQSFISIISKKPLQSLLLFILVADLAVVVFTKDSNLQLYALFFLIAFAILYTFVNIKKT